MEWLNLHTSVLDSPEVVGADPLARATWLFLLRYCCGQENGGVIMDCGEWGDRKWQQLVRVTKREVSRDCDLWKWDGENMRVNFYPTKKQQEVEAKRKAGRDTVAKRWGKQSSSFDSSDNSSAIGSADTEGEGKGKEGEGARGRSKLPDSLSTSEPFSYAWAQWQNHWSHTFNHANPMPETTAHQHLRILSAMGPARAVAAIENSIARGNFRKPEEPFFSAAPAKPQPVRAGHHQDPEPVNYGPLP
jgi:hypothetical protein